MTDNIVIESSETHKFNTNTLPLLAVGFDLGNGFTNLTIAGKSVALPSGYSNVEPDMVHNAKGYLVTGETFRVTSNDKTRWFGKAILASSLPPIRELDEGKLYADYIRAMMGAALSLWHSKYKKTLDISAYRLAIVAGMPPENYQDKAKRTRTFNAYKAALTTHRGNKPEENWYIQGDLTGKTAKRIYARFLDIYPETILHIQQNKIRGTALIADLGHGTLDICLAVNGEIKQTKSLPMGLTAFYSKVNPVDKARCEYEYLTGQHSQEKLDQYFNAIKLTLQDAIRRVPGGVETLVMFGGGTHFLGTDHKAQYAEIFKNVSILNGDCNSVAFEKLALESVGGKR